ncbi:MAG: hypothetical protein KAG86_03490 [Gammaproteobacteria bacterium]|nr:hypothetical protein [Gammaproteobacteria bacterium]
MKEINRADLGQPEIDEIRVLKEAGDKLNVDRQYITGNLPIFIEEILDLEMVSLIRKLIRIRIRTFMLAVKGPQQGPNILILCYIV